VNWRLLQSVHAVFRENFPRYVPQALRAHFVPGRVEVLGKHTDYAGGHSLVMAVDRGFYSVSAPNALDRVRMVPVDRRYPPCEFPISPMLPHAPGDWTNYPKTMVQRLAMNFQRAVQLRGVDIAFGCDLPVGAGMSGSSALMIMTYLAFAEANRLTECRKFQRNIRDQIDLAMFLACCENGQTFRQLTGAQGVGTFGGSEDHTEILCGKEGMLSLFQFCPTVHKADLAWNEEWRMAICFSGVRAEKTGAAMEHYNLASLRASRVVEIYNRKYSTRHSFLRDIADENPTTARAELFARVASATQNDPEGIYLLERFKQFYFEDREIIPQTVTAWIRSDLAAIGNLIDRSHRNSRRYLRNIVEEVDFLQQSARDLGALAASGFGAGFGGSVYAIIPRRQAEGFLRQWKAGYSLRFPQAARNSVFFLSRPGGAACSLPRIWE